MDTVVITGASSGIGLEFCRHYKQQNWHVVAACRQVSSELQELQVQAVEGVDVVKKEGRQRLYEALRGQKIQILINNAGLLKPSSLENLDEEGILQQFQVNALGPLLLTQDLRSFLTPQSKVVMISSRMGSIEDNTSGGAYGYRMSKAALNMASSSLAQDLAGENIAVGLFHPGYVKTKMTGGRGYVTTHESVQGIVQQIEDLEPGGPLQFQHTNGETLPW